MLSWTLPRGGTPQSWLTYSVILVLRIADLQIFSRRGMLKPIELLVGLAAKESQMPNALNGPK